MTVILCCSDPKVSQNSDGHLQRDRAGLMVNTEIHQDIILAICNSNALLGFKNVHTHK